MNWKGLPSLESRIYVNFQNSCSKHPHTYSKLKDRRTQFQKWFQKDVIFRFGRCSSVILNFQKGVCIILLHVCSERCYIKYLQSMNYNHHGMRVASTTTKADIFC